MMNLTFDISTSREIKRLSNERKIPQLEVKLQKTNILRKRKNLRHYAPPPPDKKPSEINGEEWWKMFDKYRKNFAVRKVKKEVEVANQFGTGPVDLKQCLAQIDLLPTRKLREIDVITFAPKKGRSSGVSTRNKTKLFHYANSKLNIVIHGDSWEDAKYLFEKFLDGSLKPKIPKNKKSLEMLTSFAGISSVFEWTHFKKTKKPRPVRL